LNFSETNARGGGEIVRGFGDIDISFEEELYSFEEQSQLDSNSTLLPSLQPIDFAAISYFGCEQKIQIIQVVMGNLTK